MIPASDLRKIAKARFADAEALFTSRRYDGAVCLCGYAVEMTLKARVCQLLKWAGYPSTSSEFRDYHSFRTHDLDVLLHLTGREQIIKVSYMAEWSAVARWSPSARYQSTGTATRIEAQAMIAAAKVLLRKI